MVGSSSLPKEEDISYVVVHVDWGNVTGKAFGSRAEAEARFDNLHPHYATILMNCKGEELRFYGNRAVLGELNDWYRQECRLRKPAP